MADISKFVEKKNTSYLFYMQRKFGNPGALSTHVKCKHGTVNMNAVKTINSTKNLVKINVDEEEVTTISRAASPEKKKKLNFDHLKKRRISHTAVFKSEVINDRESGMTPSELVKKYSNFRLYESNIKSC